MLKMELGGIPIFFLIMEDFILLNRGFWQETCRNHVICGICLGTYGSPRGDKLGGSIDKRQFYFSNGTGRDTYIMKTV
jgi:hypothetical protein